MVDHIHMLISIPPQDTVSQVVGLIKGKNAIHIARVYGGRKKNFTGETFWARRYFIVWNYNDALHRTIRRVTEETDVFTREHFDAWPGRYYAI